MFKTITSGNSVARRILVSFVLAALIPVGILGYFSFKQVESQLHDQLNASLRKSCKNYALDLLDRMVGFESTLKIVALSVKESGNKTILDLNNQQKYLTAPYLQVALIAPDNATTPLIGNSDVIPVLTDEDRKAIAQGKSLVKPVVSTVSGVSRFWMAIKLAERQAGFDILIAELNPDLLWDAENQDPNVFWIVDEKGLLLFSSDQAINLPSNRAQLLSTNSGLLAWAQGDDRYLGAFWELPLKNVFAASNMTIVQAQPEAQALSAIAQFSSIYPPVIALSVLIIAYLSIRLIAANLKPLDMLKTATQRISDGDLSYRLAIKSRDEFEALADSFNEMTRRLRNQFDIASAMAEIDRHILSSLNAEDIVDTALARLPSILRCDLISIARIDPETYQLSNIRTRFSKLDTEVATEPVKLNLNDVLDLLAMQHGVIETVPKAKLSPYTESFHVTGEWRYLIVPIVLNGNLASFICVGYQTTNHIPPESLTAARNFGDRIAVALSNAAWEEKLYQQAHYDALTGLPNRLVLNDRLNQEMARARRDDSQFAAIFLDLDRFKNVNDSLGHSAGDELLVKVSQLLDDAVRDTDLVVRLGGDEFVIVITELHNHINPLLLLSSIAEKILKSLKKTMLIAGHQMSFTASLGIAVFPRDADNAQDLLKNADAAMYHAKDQGRANFRFYSSELNASALENIKLEHELRNAIPNDELIVYYQPKVDLNGRIVGAEALIRWKHPELGLVSPAKFIPIAEQSGLIVEIGEWVLEQTCLFIKSCIDQHIEPIRISVNLSVIEFKRPELVGKVAWILSRIGVDPRYIELELTESVAIGEAKMCIDRMNDLKSLGLKLSMDDFGTGFSSLSYLKELPLDVLKIDQSFMRKLETEKNSQAIVKAILALANGLGMETVAEGVETESQLEFLKINECGIFQGYLFSRPVPPTDFLALLVNKSIQPVH